jgi:NodT family efflux transporter outer membrane factor (OMF) lipoprotein
MRNLFLSVAMLATAGCTVGPDYAQRAPKVGPEWVEPADAGPVDLSWWESFGDATLANLVKKAVAANLDIAEAQARLAEARANRDAAAGRQLPDARAVGSATENQVSENGQLPVANIPGFDRRYSLFDLGFDASWEIDLWGRNRRSLEAAQARAAAAAESARAVRLRVIAEVVRNYIDLRAAQARLQVAEQNGRVLGEIGRVAQLRFAAGEANRLEATRAATDAAAAAGVIPALRAEERAAAYNLALLTGEAPEMALGLLARAELPSPPPAIAAGLRSELLARRPDVRQAERELAAATADIGVATADLVPRFSLLGSLGQQARDAGDLLSGSSTRFSIGPSFSWPIFSGGRIRAQIRGADARAQAAAIRYDKAVLEALRDSETAINRFAMARQSRGQAEAAEQAARETLGLARRRFQAGEDNRLDALRAEAAYEAAARQLADARALELAAAAALYKALGGGWQQP